MGRGVRGYVSAYDLKTEAFRWRFYTVPVVGEKTKWNRSMPTG
jgi:hypothetical protein